MRGCEGPAEFTIHCGMYEETHTRTWEALKIVSDVFFRRTCSGVPSPGKRMLRGGGCTRSTLRQRKTATWERGAWEGVARKGNSCRTRRIGAHEPTSLWGIAIQADVLPDVEASLTEEPCEGTLHAGICAGGAGRPAFLPRRDSPYS